MRTRRLAVAALTIPVVLAPLAVAATAHADATKLGTTWTVDTARNLLTEYADGASGAATPIATLHGAATGLVQPTGVAVSSAGVLYVANAGDNAITAYAAGSTGNVAPIATIKGSATGLDAPSSIVLSGRNVWVTNPDSNVVEAFTAGSAGNELPAKSISGTRTGLDHPVGISIDPEAEAIAAIGSLIAGSGSGYPSIIVINAPTSAAGSVVGFTSETLGNVAPALRVASSATNPLVSPSAILTDGFGAVIVADRATNTLTQIGTFKAFTRLYERHGLTQIVGAKTELDAPSGLTRNALNQLIVTNANDTLTVFGQAANGDAAPLYTTTGVATPAAAAVAGTAPGAPTDLTATVHRSKKTTGSSVSLSWRPPAATGGGIVGYDVVTSKIFVSDFGRNFDAGSSEVAAGLAPVSGLFGQIKTTTTSTTYRKSGLRLGNRYAFRVIAVNAFGDSAASPRVTASLPSRPGAVQEVRASAAPHAIKLFWVPPFHNGAEKILGYRVEYGTCAPGAKGCAFRTRNEHVKTFGTTIHGLTAGTKYDVRILARNKIGLGKPSKVISVTPTA